MIDNFKARLRRKPVDSGDVAKIVERTRRIVAKDRAGLANQSLFDPQCEFVAVELCGLDRKGIPLQQPRQRRV